MDEEQKKPEDTQPEGEENPSELNIVDEARKLHGMILEEKEALKVENDRKEKIQAESLLAGTGGGNIPVEAPKEETPAEYAKKIMGGEL